MSENSLASKEKYDIIKSYAKRRHKKALNAVYSRLLNWAGLTWYPSAKEYRENNPVWLEETETAELFYILKDFRRIIGLKAQAKVGKGMLKRADAEGNTVDIEIDRPGIRGWQCGVCQMIDVQNEAICEVLPVLLTAYVYNFPDNILVHKFLEDNPFKGRNEYIYGAKYCQADLSAADEATGFAKLMFQMITYEDLAIINDIFINFNFSKFLPCSLKDTWAGPQIYLIPQGIKDDFISCTKEKYLSSRAWRKSSIGRHKLHSCEVAPAGFDFYYKDTFFGILGYFYTSICKFAKRKGSFFAKTPNPLFCWILANQTLHDCEGLKHIKQNCNQHTEKELLFFYDKVIRKAYDDAKPKRNPYAGRVDVGQS